MLTSATRSYHSIDKLQLTSNKWLVLLGVCSSSLSWWSCTWCLDLVNKCKYWYQMQIICFKTKVLTLTMSSSYEKAKSQKRLQLYDPISLTLFLIEKWYRPCHDCNFSRLLLLFSKLCLFLFSSKYRLIDEWMHFF